MNLLCSHQQRDFIPTSWSTHYFICRKKHLICMLLLLNSSISPCCWSWQTRCQVEMLFRADASFKSRAQVFHYSHHCRACHGIFLSRRTASRNTTGLRFARTFEGGVGMRSISWKCAELILPWSLRLVAKEFLGWFEFIPTVPQRTLGLAYEAWFLAATKLHKWVKQGELPPL